MHLHILDFLFTARPGPSQFVRLVPVSDSSNEAQCYRKLKVVDKNLIQMRHSEDRAIAIREKNRENRCYVDLKSS